MGDAIRLICEEADKAGRKDKPIIFNLTGNVLEDDRAKYLRSRIMQEQKQTDMPMKLYDKLYLDSNRLANAKKRRVFFEHEKFNHDIHEEDGELAGHDAIRLICEEADKAG